MVVSESLSIALFLILAMSSAGAIHVCWLKWASADFLMQPLDFGHTLAGQRIFGDNKRLRGLIAMPLAAAAIFALLGGWRQQLPDWLAQGLWNLSAGQYALLGVAAGLAFMLAELPNSFLKRRLSVAPGEIPGEGLGRVLFVLLDRFDSVVGVLILVSLLVPLPVMTWVYVLLIGPGVHALFSTLLYRLGVKARAL